MTTKEQERAALAKIRKIISDLGENSYISIAFAGCCEDAAENIENDFGCSMYDRWQHSEKELEKMRGLFDDANARLALADEKIEKLSARTFDKTDAQNLALILRRDVLDAKSRESSASSAILANCENPDSLAFCDARDALKAAKRDAERAAALLEKIQKMF